MTVATYFAILSLYLYVTFFSFGWSSVRVCSSLILCQYLDFKGSLMARNVRVGPQSPAFLDHGTESSASGVQAAYLPAQSIGVMSMWLFNGTISKLTPLMLNGIGYWTYILIAGATTVSVMWALLFYPETGGYAIEDIHILFENVVKQSLHDNKYIFRSRPDRGGHPAGKSIAEENTRSADDSDGESDRLLA